VAEFEVGELPAHGVGREDRDPPAIEVGEAELRTGMGPFLPGEHPHPRRPAGRGQPPLQQAGEVGDLRVVAGFPVGVVGGGPRRRRDPGEQVTVNPDGDADPHRVLQTQPGHPVQERLGGLADGSYRLQPA
jgi:hypothetical protein